MRNFANGACFGQSLTFFSSKKTYEQKQCNILHIHFQKKICQNRKKMHQSERGSNLQSDMNDLPNCMHLNSILQLLNQNWYKICISSRRAISLCNPNPRGEKNRNLDFCKRMQIFKLRIMRNRTQITQLAYSPPRTTMPCEANLAAACVGARGPGWLAGFPAGPGRPWTIRGWGRGPWTRGAMAAARRARRGARRWRRQRSLQRWCKMRGK